MFSSESCEKMADFASWSMNGGSGHHVLRIRTLRFRCNVIFIPGMDIAAHALYGATVCSRTGLAGGFRRRSGAMPRSWTADWTVWCAALFGILPDIVSLGIPALPYWLAGTPVEFFRHVGPEVIVVYRYMHSLVVALFFVGLIRLAWPPVFVPSLAWVLHVCMDAFMHGTGTFQTTLFYPFYTWAPDGIRWWEHPNLVLTYWLLLPLAWCCIAILRRRNRG